MSLNVYLAARYSAKGYVAELADHLEHEGFKVTSTWCRRDDDEPGLAEAGRIEDIGRQFAEGNIEDIDRSDVLVLLSCWGTDTALRWAARGGMFVEVGYALGCGMPTVLVGPRVNVFDTLHEVEIEDPIHLSTTLRRLEHLQAEGQ